MRNKVEFSLPPEALFLNPWRDPGFKLLLEPEFIWRPMPKARIEGFAVSGLREINQKIRDTIKETKQRKMFSQAIEFNAVPVVLEKASFRKSYVMARDRLVLSGASGSRLLNKYRWERAETDADVEGRLEDYFANCRAYNSDKEVPIYSGFLGSDIDFAIECRNTFNYFHFVTESLPQLTLLDTLGFQGNVYFHFPNQEEKQRPFAQAFVSALFPEFEGRVFFERAPKDYNKVLTAYDLVGSYAFMPERDVAGISELAPTDLVDKNGLSNVRMQPIIAMNSVSSTILALRARALMSPSVRN